MSMTAMAKELKPVTPQPGKPLYLTVKEAIRDAISAGVFAPGEQMPSTKELSEQLAVSLVTAHRALQELVAAGVLQRSQGKGTFVHTRYLDRERTLSDTRLGLILHRDASLADFYLSQIFEGIRQATTQLAVDLLLLRNGEDVRNECNGYIFINPHIEDIRRLLMDSSRNQPILAIGAKIEDKRVNTIDIDNIDLARDAVNHLLSLSHRSIGYIGGGGDVQVAIDRFDGFKTACQAHGVPLRDNHIINGESWRLDERERNALIRALTGPSRPTAVFAAGYYFALDVYAAAQTIGLKIPDDISIVGVDDTVSSSFLMPSLTTMRQPLVQLGHAAVTSMYERLQNDNAPLQNRTLRAELVIRRSSAAAPTR